MLGSVRDSHRPANEGSAERGSLLFTFGGQGSQYFGMGASLVQHPVFAATAAELDAVCRELCGIKVLATVHDPSRSPTDRFDDLLVSSAAIFVTEYSLYQALRAEGCQPDRLLGSSLGEIAALAAGGLLAPESALELLVDLSLVFETLCEPGGMTTILGDPDDFDALSARFPGLELVAANHSKHFVVGGPTSSLDGLEAEGSRRGLISFRLPVPFAFHTSRIEEARIAVTRLGQRFRFRVDTSDVLSGADGGVLTELDGVGLWRMVREPLAFVSIMRRLADGGPVSVVDLTPQSTLCTLLKSALPQVTARPILTPFGGELQVVRSLGAELAGVR